MEPLLGEIKAFAGNFAPQGWMTCEGQTLPINQWTALYSIIGTTYGGDGMQTFKLPDLRGAFPTQCTNLGGSHPGGTYNFGEIGGNANCTITSVNMPPHTHSILKGSGTNLTGGVTVTTTLQASTAQAATATPSTSTTLAQTYDQGGGVTEILNNSSTPLINMPGVSSSVNNTLNFSPSGLTLTPWGGGPTPVPTVPNFVAMQYMIAVEGIYPSRP